MNEATFLAHLRALPLHPGARGLTDDAATLGDLVVTTDTLVERVHFLATDPAADVAWKLVATSLSDLAAKGAGVIGVTLNYSLSDDAWDVGFLAGLREVLHEHVCPLIGGDTVTLPAGAPRILTVTAFGHAAHPPRRDGARAGDMLWVTGTIGDAGAGLRIAQGAAGPPELLVAYRRPRPRLVEGALLARHATAMMDVSDGLLIDAQRLAAASGLRATIDLAAIPLSPALIAFNPDRLTAATAGDDYELLAALPPGTLPPVAATRIGTLAAGEGLALIDGGVAVPLPARLGYQHQS